MCGNALGQNYLLLCFVLHLLAHPPSHPPALPHVPIRLQCMCKRASRPVFPFVFKYTCLALCNYVCLVRALEWAGPRKACVKRDPVPARLLRLVIGPGYVWECPRAKLPTFVFIVYSGALIAPYVLIGCRLCLLAGCPLFGGKSPFCLLRMYYTVYMYPISPTPPGPVPGLWGPLCPRLFSFCFRVSVSLLSHC